MTEQVKSRWEYFKQHYHHWPELDVSLDLSCMGMEEAFFQRMEPVMQKAVAGMVELEAGAIANPDENRMVGHYWLRNPALAPQADIKESIEKTWERIERFAAGVHSGAIQGAGGKFKNLLLIGIGGSALGPQFVARALAIPEKRRMNSYFLDNTDPDGVDLVLAELGLSLSVTLCLVISKSGGTKETRNGMLEVEQAYKVHGLDFSRHVVAVTGAGSELDQYAKRQGWIDRFPMWDWVGGRTSELSAVGLLPAALQGIDFNQIVKGAAAGDAITRGLVTKNNPAALMALSWYYSGNGKGIKDLVVLPYKDRLELVSKYLQQLIMESLGKEKDLAGNRVHQGLAVYGNKGSTDQHAYVQQLRDGLNNFFVCFINVLKDRSGASVEVEPGVTTGDYLNGFFMGTRKALADNSRQSITVTISEVDEFRVGALIALFERAVGFYASMVSINAYHQPGVEAGKKAAAVVLRRQVKIMEVLASKCGSPITAEQMTKEMADDGDPEEIFLLCRHLAATRRGIKARWRVPIWESTFQLM